DAVLFFPDTDPRVEDLQSLDRMPRFSLTLDRRSYRRQTRNSSLVWTRYTLPWFISLMTTSRAQCASFTWFEGSRSLLPVSRRRFKVSPEPDTAMNRVV